MYKMRWHRFFSFLMDTFLDLVYPRGIYCILCGKAISKAQHNSLCSSCKDKIRWIHSPTCQKCGKPLEPLYVPHYCPDCLQVHHFFTKGFSCVEYEGEVKNLIYRFKYKEERYLAYAMAQMMVQQLKRYKLETVDVVVPMPLYKKKERQRGFNQAYLLAKYIGKALNWQVDHQNLIRIKDTLPQNRLSPKERQKNLAGAFSIVSKEAFQGKSILLIDDIYTTGSTVDECSKELLKCKPHAIFVISFATGRNR